LTFDYFDYRPFQKLNKFELKSIGGIRLRFIQKVGKTRF